MVSMRGRRQNEKAAVDQAAFAKRLFDEAPHPPILDIERAEARERAHGGDGRQLAMLAMEIDAGRYIDIADAVAIGQAEGAFLSR